MAPRAPQYQAPQHQAHGSAAAARAPHHQAAQHQAQGMAAGGAKVPILDTCVVNLPARMLRVLCPKHHVATALEFGILAAVQLRRGLQADLSSSSLFA